MTECAHGETIGTPCVECPGERAQPRTMPCPSCHGRGTIRGGMKRTYISGIGFRNVPIKCTPCKGTGRVPA